VSNAKVGPILGLFGAEDKNPSPAEVAQIDAELTRLGKEHESTRRRTATRDACVPLPLPGGPNTRPII
jgi:hypothetical protein